MLKLLGCLCIFGGGAYVRWSHVREGRRELETLAALAAALEQMSQEVHMARTPMPRLLAAVARCRSGAAADFFAGAAEALRQGIPAGQAWRQAARGLPLSPEDRAVLAEVGNCLQGDEERLCVGLTQAARRLADSLEDKRRTRAEREKRTTALCFSAAALLVILLI